MGYADDGRSVTVKIQCADVKKVLCSAHQRNLRGNAVALDGGESYAQGKEIGQKKRVNREESQQVVCSSQEEFGRQCDCVGQGKEIGQKTRVTREEGQHAVCCW